MLLNITYTFINCWVTCSNWSWVAILNSYLNSRQNRIINCFVKYTLRYMISMLNNIRRFTENLGTRTRSKISFNIAWVLHSIRIIAIWRISSYTCIWRLITKLSNFIWNVAIKYRITRNNRMGRIVNRTDNMNVRLRRRIISADREPIMHDSMSDHTVVH